MTFIWEAILELLFVTRVVNYMSPVSGLDKLLMQYVSPGYGMPPLRPHKRLPGIAVINREHPLYSHYVNMLFRVFNVRGPYWNVHADPTFVGMKAPEFLSARVDKFSFFMYAYTVDMFCGPKHLYAGFDRELSGFLPDFNVGSCIHVDRRDNALHYTACNMRWLPDADNAANKGRSISSNSARRIIRAVLRMCNS